MIEGQWEQISAGTIMGRFPHVTFRLLGCYERQGEKNGVRRSRVVWFVQFRENDDFEPWFTEIDDVKYVRASAAMKYATKYYHDYYGEGAQVG